jgi:hypothetical protein
VLNQEQYESAVGRELLSKHKLKFRDGGELNQVPDRFFSMDWILFTRGVGADFLSIFSVEIRVEIEFSAEFVLEKSIYLKIMRKILQKS